MKPTEHVWHTHMLQKFLISFEKWKPFYVMVNTVFGVWQKQSKIWNEEKQNEKWLTPYSFEDFINLFIIIKLADKSWRKDKPMAIFDCEYIH